MAIENKFPGKDIKSKSDIEKYVRNYGRTSYHHVGTCKMGSDDMSVVDANLKVYGIEGLRVIDSSIIAITSISLGYMILFDPTHRFNNILEWNYFCFLLFFYFLSSIIWKNKNQ